MIKLDKGELDKREPTQQEMQKKRWLERAAIVACVCVVIGAGWYWQAQVRSVLELLEMAYG